MCGNTSHYKKDYKSKVVGTSKYFDMTQLTEGKLIEGDVYLASTSMQME